jgi:hypothetical protein
MVPSRPMTGVTTQQYAGREIHAFPLIRTVSGTNASVSPVLTAPESRLTPGLVNKMFLLRGLDIPFYIGHHTGGHLGNFAQNDANGTDGQRAQTQAQRTTIDQLLGWSSSFYSDLSQVRERVLVLSDRTSYAWQNPSSRSGAIQEVGTVPDRLDTLFNRLFPSTGGPQTRAPVVDKVLANYQRVRGNPRLSRADRDRLDDHVQRLSELQRRLTTVTSCVRPSAPAAPHGTVAEGAVVWNSPYANNPTMQTAWYRARNELVAVALSCGLSRIAVGLFDPHLGVWSGDWHQEVAHQAGRVDGERQAILWQSYNTFFKDIFLDMVTRLDAIDAGQGKTLLDQSMVVWTQEAGPETHNFKDQTIVGFGGANGRLRTGQLVDYRNQRLSFERVTTGPIVVRPGLLWHQWLGTVLQTFGIPKSEWELPATNGGYPDYNFQNVEWAAINAASAYPQAVWSAAGERLPMISI